MQIKNIKLLTLVILLLTQTLAFSQQPIHPELQEYSEEDVLSLLGASEKWIGGSVSLSLKSGKKRYKGKALEVFDNPELKSNPVIIIDAENISEGKKEINFQRKFNESKEKDKDVEFVQLNEYEFISLGKDSVVVYGNNFNEKYIQVKQNNKNYYLKISEELSRYLTSHPYYFNYYNLFIKKDQQLTLNDAVDKIPEFKTMIAELKVCVSAKDQECLFKYQYIDENTIDQYIKKNHYNDVFLVRHILDDPKLCDEWKNTRNKINESDKHIPPGIEKRVDKNKSNVWNSLDQALSLDLNYNYIDLRSTSPKERVSEVRIFKRTLKNEQCDNTIDVELIFRKRSEGWKIKSFALSHYDLYP